MLKRTMFVALVVAACSSSGTNGTTTDGGTGNIGPGGSPSAGGSPVGASGGAGGSSTTGAGGTSGNTSGSGGSPSTGGSGDASLGNDGASGASNGGASNGGAGGASGGAGASNGGASNGGASNGGASNGGASNGGASNGGASNGGASNGGASNGGASNGGASNGGASNGGASNGGAGGGPPILSCTLPFGAGDVSTPTTVVGQGTHVCDQAALSAAVKKGGVITFDCGGATTIMVTSQLELPKGKDTIIDGGNLITLDGGGSTRILHFNGGGYRTTSTKITLQHLKFQNGHGTGTKLTTYPAPCSQGYDTDAGGGAVLILDGVLRVIDCDFQGNSGQTPGPDVAGGAVYVNGSLGATIIGSRFTNNTCANGGAVGALNSDLAIYTSTMSGNTATGTGGNNTNASCTSPSTEIGDGGSGGAVYMDGGSDGNTTFCGDVFSKNHAQALGGAFFRVFDGPVHDVDIDISTLDGNVADGPVGTDGDGPGAGAFYAHAANLRVHESTISNNSSPGCGAVQADGSLLDFRNVTLSGNVATKGIGGAICIFSNGGTLTNCTLSGNKALGGSSFSDFYGAAIFGGNLTLQNTLLANNTTENSMGRMQCAGGAPEAGSHDLQWPRNKVVGGSPDSECVTGITFADPALGPLQDNGGSTATMAPGAAASVVQVGVNCPATDQTGKSRKNPCTLGALEL